MKLSTRTKKIISVLIVFVMVMAVTSLVFAAGSDGFPDAGELLGKGDSNLNDKAQSLAGGIIGVIQIVGVSFAIAMLIFVAIKYLTASAEGKAEIKKYAVGYIVGAIVLFGVSGILEVIKNFANSTVNE